MKKCPYCAEEIQDEAVICRFCGRNLAQPVQRTVQAKATYQKPQQGTNWLLISLVILGVVVLGLCVGCFFLAAWPEIWAATKDTMTQVAPTRIGKTTVEHTSTPIPTATPSSLTIDDIEKNYSELTDIQWKDYAKSLEGVRVHWIATVNEVDTGGDVWLDAGQGLFRSVFLYDLPQEVVKTLNKGQVVEFEATIQDVTTFLGLTVRLNNPTLISTK